MNIYLFFIDSLRQDYAQNRFPHLEASKKAVSSFGWSLPSYNSVLTLKNPKEVKTFQKNDRIGGPTLASSLKEKGFKTYLLSHNKFASPEYGFDDFDKYVETYGYIISGDETFENIRKKDISPLQKIIQGIKYVPEKPSIVLDITSWILQSAIPGFRISDSGLERFKEIIEEESETDTDQFFVTVLSEVHTPFFPPWSFCFKKGEYLLPFRQTLWLARNDPMKTRIESEKEKELQKKAYSLSVDYVEEKLSSWIEDKTSKEDIVIVTSDHGELLGEEDLFSHGHGCIPEQFHIPFFHSSNIRFPEFFGLYQLGEKIIAHIEESGFQFKERVHYYSWNNENQEDQKAVITPEFRQIEDRETGETKFFKPFEEEKIEVEEKLEIPDPGKNPEKIEDEEKVKYKLKQLGYL